MIHNRKVAICYDPRIPVVEIDGNMAIAFPYEIDTVAGDDLAMQSIKPPCAKQGYFGETESITLLAMIMLLEF